MRAGNSAAANEPTVWPIVAELVVVIYQLESCRIGPDVSAASGLVARAREISRPKGNGYSRVVLTS